MVVGIPSRPPDARQLWLGRIPNQLLADRVYSRLRMAILNGTLAPGERLIEGRLAGQLGVSRAPVRDALRVLKLDGLIGSGRRRGAFVNSLSAHDVWEVYVLRANLEALAFRLVISRLTPAAVDELQAIVDDMRQATARADVEALSAADVRFHGVVCRLSGNRRLHRMWTHMLAEVRLLSRPIVSTQYRDLNAVPARHQLLLDVLRQGDRELAERTVREHIDSVAERVLACLDAEEPAGEGKGIP
jgi:DNA-binding GntR family transcriptional regulator